MLDVSNPDVRRAVVELLGTVEAGELAKHSGVLVGMLDAGCFKP